MRDDDLEIDPDDGRSPFASYVRRHASRGPRVAVVLALALLATAAAGWYAIRSREAATPDPPSAAAPGGPVESSPLLSAPEPLDLPALDASDAFVTRLVATLSAHPELARWLATDELVRRFVRTVADIAHGTSPARHLPSMAPRGAFQARETGSGATIDPASYRRYDAVAEGIASVDTRGAARLLRQLQPLFEEAHAELGYPGTFESDLDQAFANLLAVRVPDRPPALTRNEAAWAYADPELEARSSAEKHLIRMGPDNAGRVQTKLADVAAALGLPSTR